MLDQRRFDIRIYDLDTHHYTPGEGHVPSETALLSELSEHQKDLEESWVVIFAGAAFEGKTERNLAVRRCRAWNMVALMSRQGKINSLGYWSVAAGEFRLAGGPPDDPAQDGPEQEDAEEQEAQKLGEEGLRNQRRLLVIAVKPLQQRTGEAAQAQLHEVVEALAGEGLLPTNYDKGRSKPQALDPTDGHYDPCKKENESVIERIENLLEGLLRRGE